MGTSAGRGKSYTLGEEAMGQVATTVRQVLNLPANPNGQRPGKGVPWQPGIVDAVVVDAITPFNSTSNTYGQGTVNIYIDQYNSNSSSFQRILDPSYNGSIVILSTSTTTGGVPSGANVGAFWRNGRLGLAFVDCGNS